MKVLAPAGSYSEYEPPTTQVKNKDYFKYIARLVYECNYTLTNSVIKKVENDLLQMRMTEQELHELLDTALFPLLYRSGGKHNKVTKLFCRVLCCNLGTLGKLSFFDTVKRDIVQCVSIVRKNENIAKEMNNRLDILTQKLELVEEEIKKHVLNDM